jgi:hypothetical protein
MIAILLSALLVIADRLDMPGRVDAVPGIAIGGRQADRVQPVDLVAVCDALATGEIISPSPARAAARDSGQAVIDMPLRNRGMADAPPRALRCTSSTRVDPD